MDNSVNISAEEYEISRGASEAAYQTERLISICRGLSELVQSRLPVLAALTQELIIDDEVSEAKANSINENTPKAPSMQKIYVPNRNKPRKKVKPAKLMDPYYIQCSSNLNLRSES